jgi:hypothetical protein
VRALDTSAVKPAPVTGIAARIGVPPPAGFGLDFLPGRQSGMDVIPHVHERGCDDQTAALAVGRVALSACSVSSFSWVVQACAW